MDKKELFTLDINNNILRILFVLVTALPISIVPLLLNRPEDILFNSLPFYITIVILFVAVIYFRYWSLAVGLVTFLLCCLNSNFGLNDSIANISVNLAQLLLMLWGYTLVDRIKYKKTRRYTSNTFYLSIYNFMLLAIIILYFVLYNYTNISNLTAVGVCFALILIATVVKAFVSRDIHLITFALFVALIPSAVCSVASAYLFQIPNDMLVEYIVQWCGSNYILLQSLGYIAYQYLYRESILSKVQLKGIFTTVKVGTLIYYFAVLAWNVIIIRLCTNDLFVDSCYLLFPPWVLGNAILGINLIFSARNYTNQNISDKFSWYEEQVVVVERNTAAVVRIIAFLLPLSISLIQSIPAELKTIFTANIFFACMSLGLVWVPSNNVKFIAILKDLKTILYSYTIVFLLLSSILIIQG